MWWVVAIGGQSEPSPVRVRSRVQVLLSLGREDLAPWLMGCWAWVWGASEGFGSAWDRVRALPSSPPSLKLHQQPQSFRQRDEEESRRVVVGRFPEEVSHTSRVIMAQNGSMCRQRLSRGVRGPCQQADQHGALRLRLHVNGESESQDHGSTAVGCRVSGPWRQIWLLIEIHAHRQIGGKSASHMKTHEHWQMRRQITPKTVFSNGQTYTFLNFFETGSFDRACFKFSPSEVLLLRHVELWS
jgi:hypothetical protein